MKPIESRTHYELLGLEPTATVDEVKAAYKEIAKIYHPDSNFFDEIIETNLSPEQLKTFQAITAAYNTLINGEKRAAYDAMLPKGLKDWDYDRPGPSGPRGFGAVAPAANGAVVSAAQSGAQKGRARKPTFGQMKRASPEFGGINQSATDLRTFEPMSQMIRRNQSWVRRILRALGL